MSCTEEVREFIISNFVFGEASFADDTSFLDSGVIDSTGILQLIAFLEQQYQITVLDEEVVPENIDSIARVVAFVARKRAALHSADK